MFDIPTFFAQKDACRQAELQNASADLMATLALKQTPDVGDYWKACTPPSLLAEIVKW